jgi:hypothetical protein
MCTVWAGGLGVWRTRTSRVISAIGEFGVFLVKWEMIEWLYFLRQMLLCRVALGKTFLQFSAMKMAHAPPGHNSVSGRPSAGGLNFPEFVVYRGEQVRKMKFCLVKTWKRYGCME